MNNDNDTLNEIEYLRKIINESKVPDDLRQRLLDRVKSLDRIIKYGGFSKEYETTYKYIYTCVSLPFSSYSEENTDFESVKSILSKNHYGMSEIKNKILDYIALLQIKKNRSLRATPSVILLQGLPGIGKTSISKSIAESLSLKFIRIPMGGMANSLELIGRSKANSDAEPGKIVKSLIKSHSLNPVILLDEVDKTGNDLESKSSVFSALIEILDPEQNYSFTDRFIDYPIDLSNIFFILTANNIGGLPSALVDRVDVIKLTGYSDEEKIIICKEYLLKKMIDYAGISENDFKIEDDVYPNIVSPLGYEAGIRDLEREFLGIGRKIDRKILEGANLPIIINNDNLKEFIDTV